jgi:class 3 adenylate cyclase/tetratricopeptide (TPR) repeat protein
VRACPSCGEANPDRFSACAFCGTALLERAAIQEERKTLSVVFCDLKDSTGLGERLDPEPLGEVLDLYFTAMTRVLTRHGGTIQKFIGDAVVAAFGIPVLHEDDALRAVRAAVEMREALARLNRQLEAGYGISLAARTGVHTGEVVVRIAVNEQQVLTGDTLNTAARLEQAAGADEILIGEATYRLVRGAVDVEAVAPLELKGKGEPVPAFRLLRVFGDEQASRRHLAPFVGREDELGTLVSAYDRAVAARRCHLVTVFGEAGVGKSRLVRALLEAESDGATILRGRCLPYGEAITFWPWLRIVREAAGIDQDVVGDEARAKVEELSGDAEIARRVASALDWSEEELPVPELFWGFRELLEGLARDRPLIVVMDDVHWGAPTFIELIEDLVERVADAPMLIVCTARPGMLEAQPDWSDGPSATRLSLTRLPDEASAQLIENMTGGLEMPDRIRATIVRAAEGNPLFVEQLVSMLIERGTLVQAGGRWQATGDLGRLEVPPSIQALLSARLDRLDAAERGLVDPASVIGLEFPSDAVREIAPSGVRDGAPEILSSLVAKRLVRQEASVDEETDFRFDHLLIRDAAYGGVLKRARAEFHEAYAEWLEALSGSRERDDMIGFHLEQAAGYRSELGPMDPHARELASRASVKLAAAGRRAFTRGDLPSAVDLLRRARETLPPDDVERVLLIPDLAEALMEQGSFDESASILREADGASDDGASGCAVARARLVHLLVDLYAGNEDGWAQRAEAEVTRATPTFEASGDQVGLATAWRIRFGAQQSALSYEAASRSAEAVMRHAESAGDVRQQRRGASGYALAALLGPMPVRDALEKVEGLVDLVEGDRGTQAVIQLFLAQLAAMDGQVDRARASYREARAMLIELGQSVLAASTSTDAAPVEVLAGDLEAAESLLRRDQADLEGLGETYLRSSVLGLLAQVLVRRGDLAGAEAIALQAQELASPDDADAQVLWRASLARCRAAQDRPDEAIAIATEAVHLTDDAEAPILRAQALTDLGLVLLAAEQPEEARDQLSAALALHERKGNRVAALELREILSTPAAAGS